MSFPSGLHKSASLSLVTKGVVDSLLLANAVHWLEVRDQSLTRQPYFGLYFWVVSLHFLSFSFLRNGLSLSSILWSSVISCQCQVGHL